MGMKAKPLDDLKQDHYWSVVAYLNITKICKQTFCNANLQHYTAVLTLLRFCRHLLTTVLQSDIPLFNKGRS